MMLLSKRLWNAMAVGAVLSISIFLFLTHDRLIAYKSALQSSSSPPKEDRPPRPIYRKKTAVKVTTLIEDNFPLLAGLEKGKLPAIASWNRPPSPHAAEKTPLFIGFTRNWPMLQQCVLSYIAAGWPAEDIYVIDNTGTMKSNFPPNPKLTLQNPFYLNVQRLTDVFGVNVLSTPTLLTFAQLQNFYLFTSLERGWDYYFWSHMDIIALAEEKYEGAPYKSLYVRALDKLKEASSPEYLKDPVTGHKDEWGIQFFAYDWLALNNVKSFMKIGAWDPFVSFYTADCDMHGRFTMHNIKMPVADAGRVLDVGGPMDLNLLFRRKINPLSPPKNVDDMNKLPEDERGGAGYEMVVEAVQEQVEAKKNSNLRNSWQTRQSGGKDEPFYRDPDGFAEGLEMLIQNGVRTYERKWGHKDCNLVGAGLKPSDAWMVEKDWVDE